MTDQPWLVMGRGGLVVLIMPDRLRAACVARGWSLSELAHRARVSRPTLRSALSGRPVRPSTAWKLARALNGTTPQPFLNEILTAS